MKLTDGTILEMAEEIMDYNDNESFTPGNSQVVNFARAIEAACQPKWLPMEKAPRDGTAVLLLVNKCVVMAWFGVEDGGDYNHPCWNASHAGAIWTDDVKGWTPLPEAE